MFRPAQLLTPLVAHHCRARGFGARGCGGARGARLGGHRGGRLLGRRRRCRGGGAARVLGAGRVALVGTKYTPSRLSRPAETLLFFL